MKAPQPTPLYDIQICASKHLKQTTFRGLQYGVAMMKKKVLIAQGIVARHIWIVRHATEPKTIKRY